MKKTKNRKNPFTRGGRRNPKSSATEDPFFEANPKRRRKIEEDDFIDSDSEEDDEIGSSPVKGEEEEEAAPVETADEKRLRIANAYLEKIRAITGQRAEEEEEEDGEGEEGEEEREGKRDSLVAKILQQEQLEDSGRARRLLAER